MFLRYYWGMTVRDGARKAGNHPVVENGARAGYAASGVLHLLLAWLSLRLAWGNYAGEADQAGAFEALSVTPVGVGVLAVLGVGFVLLGVWNLFEALLIRGDVGRRLKHLAKGLTYGVLAFGAFEVAAGTDTSSAEQSRDVTATLMGSAAGSVAVVLVGLVVAAVGGYHVYKGVARKYREDLRENPGRAIEALATLGYVAKGVSLLAVGGLFWAAVATHDPEKASGMDGALRTLLDLPLGKGLLSLVALGLVAYGIYSFARAKYARV